MTQEALRRMAVNAADALELSDKEKKALDIDDIVIPDRVAWIGYLAFGRRSGITLHGRKGSAAEKYAKEYDCRFKELKE